MTRAFLEWDNLYSFGRSIRLLYDGHNMIMIWCFNDRIGQCVTIATTSDRALHENLTMPPDFTRGHITPEMIIDYIAENTRNPKTAALFSSLQLVRE
jgi:hypothetical protein